MKNKIVSLLPAFAFSQTAPAYKNANLPIDERVDNLLKRMSLTEKIGQLNQLGGGVLTGSGGGVLRVFTGILPKKFRLS